MDFFNFSFKGLFHRARRKGRKGNLFTSKWEKSMNLEEEELEYNNQNHNSQNIETETDTQDSENENKELDDQENKNHPIVFTVSFIIMLFIMLWAAYNQQN